MKANVPFTLTPELPTIKKLQRQEQPKKVVPTKPIINKPVKKKHKVKFNKEVVEPKRIKRVVPPPPPPPVDPNAAPLRRSSRQRSRSYYHKLDEYGNNSSNDDDDERFSKLAADIPDLGDVGSQVSLVR